jgi:hypothetical protein
VPVDRGVRHAHRRRRAGQPGHRVEVGDHPGGL